MSDPISTIEEPEETATRSRGFRWPIFSIVAVAIVVFLLGGFGGSFQAKLSEVQKNDNSSFLPGSAESTRAMQEASAFTKVENLPGFVVFHRASGLTPQDKQRITTAVQAIGGVKGVDKPAMLGIQFSADGTTAAAFVPLIAKENGKSRNGDELLDAENAVLDTAKNAVGPDLDVYPAGPGGLLVAFISVFSSIDGTLLFAAIGVVVLILLLVYRSPVLWVFPLLSDVLALGIASLVVYWLAKDEIITLNGQSQGILYVLVLGAGTDYALLLIARYREELHVYENRFEAMIKAWKESAAAIVASAVTVSLGLLCLTFSELNSNKGMGPVGAVGVGCTLLVMMTFLPVALAACGRWVFWPRIPRADQATDLATHGMWGRIANTVVSNRRPAWIGATVILLIAISGIGLLKTNGLTTAQSFTNRPQAIVGQELYDAKFPKGAGAPAVIVANASTAGEVMKVAAAVPGVSTAPASVCIQADAEKVAALLSQLGTAPSGGAGQCVPPSLQVQPVNGRTVINVVLQDAFDQPGALDTVKRLRAAVHAVPGADALVGGQSAATLDVHQAAVHDRDLIIPIVLAVIFVVLSVLLRALLAPLLLIGSVVLSFAATLGVCGFVFSHVFNFSGADQSFPLFAFVFLVALGIDYNIFLMTRVREESQQHGTRPGIRRGLAVTGGVITSAGVVLAATFAVLGVMPLVFLAEVGFAVAFGVLLDTIVVRSVLVPALSYDIGKRIWWPSPLARRE
ncbi:MMPL family transporter [Skermania sp. ID1734]|uniref:MMPL family transporter n=1 Tax=Skermania sp. ID1734 TaxID=2597516 RepID=UPI00117F840B|nr:MMPL family transporter [Skermania sp. ID1734]TSD99229.1 MMPL family transporter [Skermania sp. ID1734]